MADFLSTFETAVTFNSLAMPYTSVYVKRKLAKHSSSRVSRASYLRAVYALFDLSSRHIVSEKWPFVGAYATKPKPQDIMKGVRMRLRMKVRHEHLLIEVIPYSSNRHLTEQDKRTTRSRTIKRRKVVPEPFKDDVTPPQLPRPALSAPKYPSTLLGMPLPVLAEVCSLLSAWACLLTSYNRSWYTCYQ